MDVPRRAGRIGLAIVNLILTGKTQLRTGQAASVGIGIDPGAVFQLFETLGMGNMPGR